MKNKLIAMVTLASLLFTSSSANAVESISGQGSSFAGNIISSCAATYAGASVTYTPTGSGSGRQAFTAGLNSFVASDVPYGPTETKPSNFTYVPMIGGAIAFIYNIPSAYKINDLKLTPATVAKILDGRITMWNDPTIKLLNPKASLPNKTIFVHYRSGSSGTTGNLAKYLLATGQKNWTADSGFAIARGSEPGSNFKSMPNSVTLVNAVDDTSFSFGYVDLSDALFTKVSYASVRNAYGEFIKPSVSASRLFLAQQTVKSDGTIDIDYTKKVKGGYNLSLITYALAYTSGKNIGTQSTVAGFLKYIVSSCANAQGPRLGYVALSGTVQTKALALIKKIK